MQPAVLAMSGFDKAAMIATVATALLTLAGVIASLFFSTRALREVQNDRQLRQAPFLVFDHGGWRLPVKFVAAGAAIPGLRPAFVATMYPNLPAGAESVRLAAPSRDSDFGALRNLGAGPAIATQVTWVARAVTVGTEEFRIDEKKLQQAPYASVLNTMPAGHLMPDGQPSQLTRLPAFIEKDIERKVTRVEALLLIRCRDVAAKDHVFVQEVLVMTGYREAPPWVHVTFGDVVTLDEPESKTSLSDAARTIARLLLPLTRA
jgi:hypothetical protein